MRTLTGKRVRQATVENVVVKMTRIAALVTCAIVLDKLDIANLTVPSATKNVIVVERGEKVDARVVDLESDDLCEEQLQRDTGSLVDVCVQFGSFSNTRT